MLGYPFALGDRITKAMPPPVMGKDIPLGRHLRHRPQPRYAEAGEFRALYDADPDVKRVVDTARGLEGLKRQWGVHAAGVILCARAAARRHPDPAPRAGRRDHHPVRHGRVRGARPAQDGLPRPAQPHRPRRLPGATSRPTAARRSSSRSSALDDPQAYELLARGDTLGVFQLDGGPMRALLRSMQPDIVRGHLRRRSRSTGPGPMGANAHNDYADRKNGRKPVEPIHPELAEPLAEILDDTYGLIVYQEQVMAIAQKVAGYTLGSADLLRRAMGKKKKEILDKEYVPFSDGHAAPTATPTRAIKTLWDILVPFSDYAFNKAHTAGYGLVSYWTAYLKANYPAEYMAALLTSRQGRQGQDRRSTSASAGGWASRCCRRTSTSPTPTSPRSAPTSGSACPRSATSAPTSSSRSSRPARPRAGSPTSPTSCARSSAVACNKRTVESLIKAGAFDSLGHTRRGLVDGARARRSTTCIDIKRNEAIGQDSTCSAADDDAEPRRRRSTIRDPAGEWDKTTLLAFEREMLGLYVSDHPLFGVEHVLAGAADCSIAAADRRRRARRRPGRHGRRASSPASSARSPSRAARGRSRRSRTSTASSR